MVDVKSWCRLGLVAAALSLQGVRADIKIDVVPKKQQVEYNEPITYDVHVKNEGGRKTRVDIEVQWPKEAFEAVILKRSLGKIDYRDGALRWFGFGLNAGALSQGLRVTSIAPIECPDKLRVTARDMRTRKEERSVDFIMSKPQGDTKQRNDHCCDYINIAPNGSLIIDVFSDHLADNDLSVEVIKHPKHGQLLLDGCMLQYFHEEGAPSDEAMTDGFCYAIYRHGSPELIHIEEVHINITSLELTFCW